MANRCPHVAKDREGLRQEARTGRDALWIAERTMGGVRVRLGSMVTIRRDREEGEKENGRLRRVAAYVTGIFRKALAPFFCEG